MDIAQLLTEFQSPIIVLFCLVVGYVIKKMEYIPNKFIPLIMFFIGGISGVITTGLSFESIVIGTVSGVASTGLYELFRNLIEGGNSQ